MKKTKRSHLTLLTLASAVLLPLALPNAIFPYGNSALGFVCLAPLFFAVSLAPTFKSASVLGVLFGAVSTALANFWLMFFQGYSIWTYGGTILGYIGYNALLFPFLRGFALLRPRYRPFLLAGAWAVYEYLKSVGFLGYPWGLVANPAWDLLPLIQLVDTTGIWGLSLLMAMINAMIGEAALAITGHAPPARGSAGIGRAPRAGAAVLHGSWHLVRQCAFLLILVTAALGYGAYRLAAPIPSTGSVRLLLVQQNIDPWTEGRARTDSTRINQELTAAGLKKAAGPVDMVVWSEISVPDIWVVNGNQFQPRKNSLVLFVQSIATPVLTGQVIAVNPARREFMNGAVLLAADGRIRDTYGKSHPVPFAESIPFYQYDSVKWFFKNVVGVWNPWVMGTRLTIFTSPKASGGSFSFGAPICFEDAFADLCRRFVLEGADVWLNLTNDYWSKTTFSEVQHFQVALFRAVENRRTLVRSTNGGVTCVVGPWGNVTASLPLFERGTLEVEVPLYREDTLTPYTRYGDYFPLLIALFLLAALAAGLFEPRGRGGRPAARPPAR
jgi:apolipoprotein N-acyltransferase